MQTEYKGTVCSGSISNLGIIQLGKIENYYILLTLLDDDV